MRFLTSTILLPILVSTALAVQQLQELPAVEASKSSLQHEPTFEDTRFDIAPKHDEAQANDGHKMHTEAVTCPPNYPQYCRKGNFCCPRSSIGCCSKACCAKGATYCGADGHCYGPRR